MHRPRITELDLMMMRAGRVPFDADRMRRDFLAVHRGERRVTRWLGRLWRG